MLNAEEAKNITKLSKEGSLIGFKIIPEDPTLTFLCDLVDSKIHDTCAAGKNTSKFLVKNWIKQYYFLEDISDKKWKYYLERLHKHFTSLNYNVTLQNFGTDYDCSEDVCMVIKW